MPRVLSLLFLAAAAIRPRGTVAQTIASHSNASRRTPGTESCLDARRGDRRTSRAAVHGKCRPRRASRRWPSRAAVQLSAESVAARPRTSDEIVREVSSQATRSLAEEDDPKWYYKIKDSDGNKVKKYCGHVAGEPEKRCARIGKKKITAKDACAESCKDITCSAYGGKDVGECSKSSGSGGGGGSSGSFVANDKTIYKAVEEWFDDEKAAKQKYGHISTWKTGKVTNMDYLLGACWSDSRCVADWTFNEDISEWDTGKVTSMVNMFRDLEKFDQNLGGWDVGKVKDFSSFCEGCYKFNNGGSDEIKDWNTKSATTMYEMFEDCEAFNQPIGTWDVRKVKDMSYMFKNAQKFNQPLGEVLDKKGKVVQKGWDPKSVTTTNRMFEYAYKFNQDLSSWNMKKIKIIKYMFSYASKFNQKKLGWGLDEKKLDANFAFQGTKCEKNSCGAFK